MGKITNQSQDNDKLPDIYSYVSLVILSGLAFIGIQELIDSKPIVQAGFGIITILLLIKTVLKR